jgi:hypothetical protein
MYAFHFSKRLALRVFMLYYVSDKYATIFRLAIYIFSGGPVEATFF